MIIMDIIVIISIVIFFIGIVIFSELDRKLGASMAIFAIVIFLLSFILDTYAMYTVILGYPGMTIGIGIYVRKIMTK